MRSVRRPYAPLPSSALLALTLLLASSPGQGPAPEFAAVYAVASDRAKVLEQLVPGTVDYYYYHCLHAQHTGAFGAVAPLLDAWIQRHGRSKSVVEIENRQALLTFANNPEGTFDFLRQKLGLRYDAQRQVAGERSDLPTQLDQGQLSPSRLSARAVRLHPGTLDGLRDSALLSFQAAGIPDSLLAAFLRRLERPDLPNLPGLIARELQQPKSSGFGSLGIHGQLLKSQLDELLRIRPGLLEDPKFVAVYVRRLLPNNDVDWRSDPDARRAYLDRLRQFTDRLSPAHNGLKSHVLYHYLAHDLAVGELDRDRFLAYLRLPRRVGYANPEFLRRSRGTEVVQAGQGFPTGMAKVGGDEPLVRACFDYFFQTEESYAPYAEFVREDWLERVFAESRILAGRGDMERWYSMLDDPGYYQQLVARVELDFPPTQQRHFAIADDVSIDLDVKNVETLLVKLFEIDAYAYLRDNGTEVDASIDLDGVRANHEVVHRYDEPALRRVRRKFEFPQLSGAGTWVIEFVGNGLSSRAVIQKGRLHALERLGSAGHVFTVVDEQGQLVRDAVAFVAGHEYVSDEGGEIVVPFSPTETRRPLVLRRGAVASLQSLAHVTENYTLLAGVFVDRESLRDGARARLLVRPQLSVRDVPIDLELLEDPVIEIAAKSRDGVVALQTIRSPDWQPDGDYVHEFQVPRDLAELQVTVRGRVENLSAGRTDDLVARAPVFRMNGIDATADVTAPMLGRTGSGWFLEVCGKSGEPVPGRAVQFRLSHRDYVDPIAVELATDGAGRIDLGALEGIVSVQVDGFSSDVGAWQLDAGRGPASSMTGIAGETFMVPYFGDARRLDRSIATLLEYRGGLPNRDASAHLALDRGFVVVRDLSVGDYQLNLAETGRRVSIRVTDGPVVRGWAIGSGRAMRLTGRRQLQILDVVADDAELGVDLANASPNTRVHVFATRYLPAYDPLAKLWITPEPTDWTLPIQRSTCSYAAGRQLADELRYVLERRYASKYPGNMLARPGLLLNPWASFDWNGWTSQVGLGGGSGGRFGGRGGGAGAAKGVELMDGAAANPGRFANLDFLPGDARLLTNLRPGEQGRLRVPRRDLGNGQHVHVVVVDGSQTVYRSVAFEAEPLQPRDRRLRNGLDPSQHFAEQRRIEFVSPGGEAIIEDTSTAELETLSTLADVHRLLLALSGDADLGRFTFLLRWPTMSDEEKRESYRQHACHELHFFLHQKDPLFFDTVLRPYLANKAHKTFLDHWLLDGELGRYLEPWSFARLNLVEKILLLQRLPGQQEALVSYVRQQGELLPIDATRQRALFQAALRSGELEGGGQPDQDDDLGIQAGKSGRGIERLARDKSRDARPDDMKEPQLQEAEESLSLATPRRKQSKETDAPEPPGAPATGSDEFFERLRDRGRRGSQRQLYRAPDPTRQFVEHDYWHRTKDQEDPQLIAANAFWRDFANAPVGAPFVSRHVPFAAGSFTEAMFALSVLDMPFSAEAPVLQSDGSRLTVKPGTPLLLVRSEIRPAVIAADTDPVLVRQDHFRLDDRYMFVGAERRAKYVRGEFLTGVGYGCQVVITNPTGTPRRVEMLLQIPGGSLPLENGFATRSVPVHLDAFATATAQYAFYFPRPGDYAQFPVHVTAEGSLLAAADPAAMRVVTEPSSIDTASWERVSQDGSALEVLSLLEHGNLGRIDLGRIAWRLRDIEFFTSVTELLRRRLAYDDTIWSYSLLHRNAQAAGEYLQHQDSFVAECGWALESPLLTIDPIQRHAYQHMDFDPLFHSRAHRIGLWQRIAHPGIARQWSQFVHFMCAKPRLDSADWASVASYMLLQGRIEEAIEAFGRVDRSALPMKLQYDYMAAYLAFYRSAPSEALAIAEPYRQHPVERWRLRFAEVLQQVEEIQGGNVAIVDSTNRQQQQGALAAGEPMIDIAVSDGTIVIRHQNLTTCEVRYHLLDVEFAFSNNPFAEQGTSSVSWVEPRRKEVVTLAVDGNETAVTMPAEFQRGNVVVEVRSGSVSRRTTYLASAMTVQTMEGYGRLQVATTSGAPLPEVYVKVFARMPGGEVRFHKDGYTDLRGRFDYASVSGRRTAGAERYSVLLLSESDGAVVREVAPPGS